MDSRERLLSRQEEARPVPVQRPERPAEEGARNEVPRPQSHPGREKREEVNYVSQQVVHALRGAVVGAAASGGVDLIPNLISNGPDLQANHYYPGGAHAE